VSGLKLFQPDYLLVYTLEELTLIYELLEREKNTYMMNIKSKRNIDL